MTFKIDYLFNVLFRSSKFISVLFGQLIFKSEGHHNIRRQDLYWGLVMTLGVFIFNLGSENKSSVIYSIEGFLFGFFSLFCDSCVSHFQQTKEIKGLTYLDLTLGMNIFIFVTNMILATLTSEIFESFSFVAQYPSVIYHILPQQLLLVMGLLIIYYHLHIFGTLSVAYIATIRKLFTITLSIVFFNHPMNELHAAGLGIVLLTIAVDFWKSLQKKKKRKEVEKGAKAE